VRVFLCLCFCYLYQFEQFCDILKLIIKSFFNVQPLQIVPNMQSEANAEVFDNFRMHNFRLLGYYWYCGKILFMNNCEYSREKLETSKKAQHGKIENVAGSVWLNLFMDRNGKCKLPSTPSSTGLSRFQHWKWTGKI
jgi:hypothetical protein